MKRAKSEDRRGRALLRLCGLLIALAASLGVVEAQPSPYDELGRFYVQTSALKSMTDMAKTGLLCKTRTI